LGGKSRGIVGGRKEEFGTEEAYRRSRKEGMGGERGKGLRGGKRTDSAYFRSRDHRRGLRDLRNGGKKGKHVKTREPV